MNIEDEMNLLRLFLKLRAYESEQVSIINLSKDFARFKRINHYEDMEFYKSNPPKKFRKLLLDNGFKVVSKGCPALGGNVVTK